MSRVGHADGNGGRVGRGGNVGSGGGAEGAGAPELVEPLAFGAGVVRRGAAGGVAGLSGGICCGAAAVTIGTCVAT